MGYMRDAIGTRLDSLPMVLRFRKMSPGGDGLRGVGTNIDAPNTAYVDPSYGVSLLAYVGTSGSYIETPSFAFHPTNGAVYAATRYVPEGNGFTGGDVVGRGVIRIARIDDGQGGILPLASVVWITITEGTSTQDIREPNIDFLSNGCLVLTYVKRVFNPETGGVKAEGNKNATVMTCAAGLNPTDAAHWSAPTTVPTGFTEYDDGSPSGFLEVNPTASPGLCIFMINGSNTGKVINAETTITTICATINGAGVISNWSEPVHIVKGNELSGFPYINEPTMALDSEDNWIMLIRDNTNKKLWVTKRTAADVASKGIAAPNATWSATTAHLTTLYGGPNLRKLSDGTLVLVARASSAIVPWKAEQFGVYSSCVPGTDATQTANWARLNVVDNRLSPSAWSYGQIRELPAQPGMFMIAYTAEYASHVSALLLRVGTARTWGIAPNGVLSAPAVYSEGDVRAGTGVTVGEIPLLLTSGQVSGTNAGPWTSTSAHVFAGARAFNTSGGIVHGWRLDVASGSSSGTVIYEPNFTPGFDMGIGFPSGVAGILAKTLEDALMADTDVAAALTSGVLLMCQVRLFKGQEYKSATARVGATAAVSPTHQWMSLHDKNGAVLAVSADGTTGAIAANGPKKYTFATPCIAASTGVGYIGMVVTAATVPSLLCKVANAEVVADTDRGCARAGTNNNSGSNFTTPPALEAALALTTGSVTAIPLMYLK